MPVELVTNRAFATFVRTEAYFEPAHWWMGIFRGDEGGDQILDRIGFDWVRQDEPAAGVTWFEASAYACWRNGRLPWADEIATERGADRERWGRWGSGDRLGGRGSRETAFFDEWCADWFNEKVDPQRQHPGATELRRLTAPSSGGLRVVYAERPMGMVPSYRHPNVTFRVCPDHGRRAKPVASGPMTGPMTGSMTARGTGA